MCGFVGQLNFNNEKIQNTLIEKMLFKINHRGPDSKGFYFEKHFGVGHCRLSIQDLSEKGKQPMISEDGRFIIAYNGEVYNFIELRKKLEKKNYKFKSRTDTEVILNGFIEWREEVVNKLNGMFSFIIWDKKLKYLYGFRDRYGIKPLYYYLDNNVFIFSSEIKGILENHNVKRKINMKSLKQYLIFQNNLTNETLFYGINSIPAGTFYKFKNKKLVKKQYWKWNFFNDQNFNKKKKINEELLSKIKNAVSSNLVSSVPISSYLSSGLDSTLITYFAKEKIQNLKTFTIGFTSKNKNFIDETLQARKISRILKTMHHENMLDDNCIEKCLSDLTYAIENPKVGQSYPNYYASEFVSKNSKVVLSGIGGDEIFGGYPWRYFRNHKDLSFEEFTLKYFDNWQRIMNFEELYDITGEDCFDEMYEIFLDKFEKRKMKLNNSDFINHSLEFEAQTFLQGLLCIEDKISMNFSLETRVPFLDNELVDFVQKLPAKEKILNLHSDVKFDENIYGNKKQKYNYKNKDGKKILREISETILPKFVSDNKKIGFSGPDEFWFRKNNFNLVKNNLDNKDEPIYELLNFKKTRNLISEHINEKKNRRLMIWSFIQINQWLKNFF
tara:strand:- start:167 stop:2005 length:1839 start_codon:yes stop_codon:yes gene_type:complete